MAMAARSISGSAYRAIPPCSLGRLLLQELRSGGTGALLSLLLHVALTGSFIHASTVHTPLRLLHVD